MTTIITFTEWCGRFTDAEYSLMRHRMRGIQFVGPNIQRRFDVGMAENSVDLDDPIMPLFADALVSQNVISQARADIIFGGATAPPPTGISAHLTEDGSNDFHGISQNLQQYSGTDCTVQAWLKSSDRQAGFEIYTPTGGARVYFDLAVNEVYANFVYGDGSFSQYTMAIDGPGPNGWWNCSATLVVPAATDLSFWIGIDKDQAGGAEYQGDGASFIQVWQPSVLVAGQNILVSPHDLTASVWKPTGVTVQNFPDDILPAGQ